MSETNRKCPKCYTLKTEEIQHLLDMAERSKRAETYKRAASAYEAMPLSDSLRTYVEIEPTDENSITLWYSASCSACGYSIQIDTQKVQGSPPPPKPPEAPPVPTKKGRRKKT